MDGFEANKILMAVILALLIGMIAGKISRILVQPKTLAENVYVVEGVEQAGGNADSSSSAKEYIPEPIEPLLADANIQNGRNIAKKCLQCHSFEKGAASKVGPNLWNVVDAPFGHMAGFAYSAAIKERKDRWTYAHLNGFLHKPKEFLKGTKMTFVGLKNVQERADLIAYLRTLSDSPAPLPAKQTETKTAP